MADDSGDSDIDPRPSCSQNRRSIQGNINHGGGNCTENKKGRKRRIVMRIEFDDSGEDISSSSEVSGEDGQAVSGKNNESKSSSKSLRRTRQNSKPIGVKMPIKNEKSDDSDEIHRNNSQRLRKRRTNMLYFDGSDTDGSSSGSEINRSVKSRVMKSSKEIIISEDEQIHLPNVVDKSNNKQNEVSTETGFNSDSSSNELLEKCPICLLTFRQQEIGSPATCAHIFCANCIEAWSKNVQTCPIDRIEFDRIIVRNNFENRRIVRELNVDPNKITKELVLDDEAGGGDEDVTYCEVCNSPDREDVMLLCDECNQGYHMDCLTPRLTRIPEGSWYCDNCFDPSAESDNVSEDLNMLYEDIRDMGIPQAALRVTELQQPRILRTRQNERIRAAVLRTTRNRARIETSTTTTINAGTSRSRGRPRNSTTTTTTRTTRPTTTRRKLSRRRRRRARKRTYVVEYDLNNFDEKFAIKTTKKIIRRRRRKRRDSERNTVRASAGGRMTASKRLAEQMGVKKDPTYTSHLSGTSAGLSLFGGANDLEYFSDSDNGGIEHEIQVETGHGTAMQTSIRISNYGSQRTRKGILLGCLKGNNRGSALPDLPSQTAPPTSGDILSSIMNIQDRWHNAARQWENVHISPDGTLQLPNGGNNNRNTNESCSRINSDSNSGPTSGIPVSAIEQQSSSSINPLERITQAPMYSRGGGNPNFAGGGGGSGNYNNRYSNNQNNYRGSGGGGQYRHSMGGSSSGDGNDGSRGNYNYNNQNLNNSNTNQNTNFLPFSMRFNQRTNQRNNNQRNSLPFMHRNDDDRQQQQNQSQNTINEGTNPFRNRPPLLQQQNISTDNPLFGDLPPPVRAAPPSVVGPTQVMTTGPLGMTGPPPVSGLPSMVGPPPILGPLPMTGPPPQAMSGPPPPLAMHSPLQTMRPLMSVPPPPAPPPGVPMPWSTPLFQQMNNDYGNDDDDSNCPNFSVYSAESQEVAKSTEMQSQTQHDSEAAKEDDENEDLVQLDDDDEIPMPPDTNLNQSTTVKDSDLYEPENPTEENEDDDDNDLDAGDDKVLKKRENVENNEKESMEKTKGNHDNVEDIASPCPSQHNSTDNNSQYDPEHEIISNEDSNMAVENNKKENLDDYSTSKNDTIEKGQEASEGESQHSRSPSPTASEAKLPENDVRIGNKKGVLELYDDSDWEELDIDKPKEYKKAAKKADKSDIEDGQSEEEEEEASSDKVKERSKRNNSKGKESDDKNEGELDRSYTPCLDENNEPEESHGNEQSDEVGTKSLNASNDANEQDTECGKTPEVVTNASAGIETELISDDDDNARGLKKRRSSKKRDKRDKKIETFKKVSNKQKVRNYRTDKQQVGKYKERHPSSKSRSRTRSRSKSISRTRSRTRSRSRSRIRSRTRSPRGRSRSPHSGRSRSRSPRVRGRRRSRSRSLRSRSPSNNKENNWRQGGRYNNNQNRFQDRNKQQSQYRPKRREIPRYNVRNVVGIQRSFREGREVRDRYGRDTSRQLRNISRSPSPRTRRISGRSTSRSRSLGRSVSPRRNRRGSFSISPSPQRIIRRQSASPRQRYRSPRRNSLSPRRMTPRRTHSRSSLRMQSRSLTPQRMGGRKVIRRVREGSPLAPSGISHSPSPLHSLSASPRYTPRLHRSQSKTPSLRVTKGKKKKIKEKGKKKKKKRLPSISPESNLRISRQRDAFEVDRPPKKKRHHSPKQKSSIDEPTWSPSPSPAPVLDYERDNNVSWTPPLVSPRLANEMHEIYEPEERRSNSRSSKRDKRTKRIKKKKKGEKRREVRKDKRRTRRTQTPEPVPSKEVFASGNNILVSVSFNKDAVGNQPPSQTTVVTLPATREDLHTIRRNSIDCLTNSNVTSKKKKKRKKLDAKPVAIIDLERSPFQVHQEPADVIVLTDSEEGVGGDSEHELEREHVHEHDRRRENHREHRRSASITEDMDHHRSQMSNGIRSSSQLDKTPPLERERLDTILEESYDLPQTGPKTPPEPPTVKFNITTKKQNKVRNNPLHDDAELNSESEMADVRESDTHRSELEPMHVQSSQKIGPNTPPESGPCSPDAYDPFDPTKSPSMSPRSPSPAPLNSSQASIGMDSSVDVISSQKHIADEQRLTNERTTSQTSGASGSMATQGSTLNPVELVMKLMNTKQNSSQDLNKSNDSQYNTATHMHASVIGNPHDEGLSMRDKVEETMGLTVISNVLLSNVSVQGGSQHIPVISSPSPMMKSNQISKLPLPKVGSSVGSSSGAGMTSSNSNARNGGLDEPVNLNEMESPYSPGSADYEDLFEPPPDSTGAVPRRSKRANNTNAMGKVDVFDNLFGSTSPVGHTRMPKKFKTIVTSSTKKAKIKVTKTDDHVKVYDDVPNSAVELQVKDKFLRKLNRQERVVEEVKLVLKPRFNKKQITKDDYKEIMRRAVPKICHSRSGEINPHKIKNLIEAYVRKFRAKHKKLNLLNTGQVSSAVKCAAYLKKL